MDRSQQIQEITKLTAGSNNVSAVNFCRLMLKFRISFASMANILSKPISGYESKRIAITIATIATTAPIMPIFFLENFFFGIFPISSAFSVVEGLFTSSIWFLLIA